MALVDLQSTLGLSFLGHSLTHTPSLSSAIAFLNVALAFLGSLAAFKSSPANSAEGALGK